MNNIVKKVNSKIKFMNKVFTRLRGSKLKIDEKAI